MATEGSKDRLLEDANACSCWCLPVYGNVLPFADPKDMVGSHAQYWLPYKSIEMCILVTGY